MSAFEVCVTPTRKRAVKKNAITKTESKEPTFVSFGPFTGKSTVTFENVPITKTARRTVIVQNPTDVEIKVLVTRGFRPEYNIALEWTSQTINAHGQASMEISWTPLKEIACRELFQITDSRNFKKDITVILKSVRNGNGSKANKSSLNSVSNNRPLVTLKMKMKSPTGTHQLNSNIKRKSLRRSNLNFDENNFKKTVLNKKPSSPLVEKNQISYINRSPQLNLKSSKKGKENNSPVSPVCSNASTLFDNIQFTPVGNKKITELDYLASLPTPDNPGRYESKSINNYNLPRIIISNDVIESNLEYKENIVTEKYTIQKFGNTPRTRKNEENILMRSEGLRNKYSKINIENNFDRKVSRLEYEKNTCYNIKDQSLKENLQNISPIGNHNNIINKTYELNGTKCDSMLENTFEKPTEQHHQQQQAIMNCTTIISGPRPLSMIEEEDKELCTSHSINYLGKTFDFNSENKTKQQPPPPPQKQQQQQIRHKQIDQLNVVPLRKFSESMKDLSGKNQQQTRISLIANQGSMPNLSDMENLNSIAENRYYDKEILFNGDNQGNLNISTGSMMSVTSTADILFNQNEILAASSRFNIYDIGTNSVKKRSPNFLKVRTKSQPSPTNNFQKTPKTPRFKLKRISLTPTAEQERKIQSSPSLTSSVNHKRLRKSVGDLVSTEQDTLNITESSCLIISPPKRTRYDYESSSSSTLSSVASTEISKNNNLWKKRGSSHRGTTLTLIKRSVTPRKSTIIKQEQRNTLYNPDMLFHSCMAPDPFAATTTIDPFITATMYLDERSVAKHEIQIMKWLNALVSIPAEFDSDCNQKIDVGHLFTEVRNKTLTLAPTKEQQSIKYLNSSRMEALRQASVKLFHSDEIKEPCYKVATLINKQSIQIRQDRNLHLDIVMQKEILALLLNFQPLWLRIGLEVVFGEKIPLHSNTDIVGLSSFIVHRLFRDKYLEQKYSRAYALSKEYSEKIKKFTLQKILFLLLFLDKAKEKRIIKHNPCLFVKNSQHKETREVLLRFSSELIASIGDITRVLRRYGYCLTHKQTFLDEFNYAFNNLAVDLRDGVRLTRVMEIILMRDDLSKQLRVPAISRLQRIYNVNLSLNALSAAEFILNGNITASDIVDGHREKTLSLLWQIIYKFRAPKFNSAATIIQKWWKNLWLRIVIHRRIQQKIEMKRNNAAIRIQSLIRGYLARKYTKEFRKERELAAICLQKHYRRHLAQKKLNYTYECILTIQIWWRSAKITQKIRENYLNLRNSIIKIQIWYRRIILARKLEAIAPIIKKAKANAKLRYESAKKIQQTLKSYVIRKRLQILVYKIVEINRQKTLEYKCTSKIQSFFKMIILKKKFIMKKQSAEKIQNYWRAYVAMKQAKFEYVTKRKATITLQRYVRSYLQMKKERSEYLKIRYSVIILQNRFRAMKMGAKEKKNYQVIRQSVIKIQQFYRNVIETRKTRNEFLKLKFTVIKIQQKFRANKMMKNQLALFKTQKSAAITLQCYYRARLQMRKERAQFLMIRENTIKIQRKLRATLLAKSIQKNFIALRYHVTKIQQRFRANCLMKTQRKEYVQLKRCSIIIQRRLRAQLQMKFERSKYLLLKKSTIIIQQRFKAYKQMRIARAKYHGTRLACICIQNRFREYLLMKKERKYFLTFKNAAIILQRRFRAKKSMETTKKEYLKMKYATIIIQNRFRAMKAMKEQKFKYLKIRESVIKIQTWYRSVKLRDNQRFEYLKLRKATLTIQVRYRAYKEMKTTRDNYMKLKQSAISIQRYFRANKCMKIQRTEYIRLKTATILIQRKLRATILRNNQRAEFLKIRSKIVTIQHRFRAHCEMKKIKSEYENYRKNIICIQQRFRAKRLMEKQRTEYLKLKNAAVVIQRQYKAKIMMKIERVKFLELNYYAIIVQRRLRANWEMRKQRHQYLRIRELIIFVQRFYKSKLQMRKERSNFLKLKFTTIFIQQKYRARILGKIEKQRFEAIKYAITNIQNNARGYLARKRFKEMMTTEMREHIKQRKAAITIQRYWRGYSVRKRSEGYKMKLIRTRIKFLNRNVKPQNTVKYQLNSWIKCLRGRYNLHEALNVLTRMESVSRVLPHSLMEHAEHVSTFCYGIMAQAIRSEIDKHLIELCSRIVLNMARYDCTTVNTFQENVLITIAQILLRWCDKECGIFNTLCTLIWIFSHYPDKRRKIRAFMTTSDAIYMLRETKKLVLRKEKMKKNVRKLPSSTPQKQNQQLSPQTLPNFEPDFGVIRNKPYTFICSIFAFETVLKALHIDLDNC